MKEITFFVFALVSTISFGQVFPIDYSDPLDMMFGDGCSFITALDSGDDVGSITGGGTLFDNAQLMLAENLDLSDNANNTITFRIKPMADYGTRSHLLKFENGNTPDTELPFTTTGNDWQIINLDFPAGLGNYGLMVLFTDFNNTSVGTYLVDDFAGGTNIAPVPDPDSAPLPSSPDNETYSIYNDNNNYTTTFPFSYSFGTLGGEPDLDPGPDTNLALKFDFSFAGYGAGEGGPDDVSSYQYVNFMYWAVPGVPGFQFRMISNDGAVMEYTYEIGTQEPIVNAAWTLVTIPMTYFTSLGFSSTNFFQWKFEAFMQVVTDPGTVYIDNIILTQNLLSVADYSSLEFKIYPNPSNNNWQIDAKNKILQLEVMDALGKQVLLSNPNSKNYKINGDTLNSGVYFLKISFIDGIETVKIVKD